MSKRRTQKTNSLDSDEVLEEPADELDYGQISACKEEHASPGDLLPPEQVHFSAQRDQEAVNGKHWGGLYEWETRVMHTMAVYILKAAKSK